MPPFLPGYVFYFVIILFMAVIQPLIDLVDILAKQGLTHAVICPGSRSAAITLSFARNTAIETIVSIDERTAGFLALGMAVEQNRPVALVCTSGTAAYNFAPAVAEAFFQGIPLIIITADRPKEWVHQQDGQTIYQNGLFGHHVKISREFATDNIHPDSIWFANRLSNEIYLSANTFPKGPVHLNVPIREPFYPQPDEVFEHGKGNRIIGRLPFEANLPVESWHQLQSLWEDSDRILIAAGQGYASGELQAALGVITDEWGIPVLGDVTSNLGQHPDFISLQDLILQPEEREALKPELLITFGQSFLSKQFKNFIRKNPPLHHWHIGQDVQVIDSFQTLTLQVPVDPTFFFRKIFEDIDYKHFVENAGDTNDEYKQSWLRREYVAARVVNEQLTKNLSVLDDLTCVHKAVSSVESEVLLHLGNSMPVRHANLLKRLGLSQNVWANRGTSGIDGCVSTAIGAALASPDKKIVLIVGDVSFLYDRNGFLIDQLPGNLKVVVLNNGGGNIFRMIDGPRKQPELERFFETHHRFTAESTATAAGVTYLKVTTSVELDSVVAQFTQTDGTVILEFFTDKEENKRVLDQIRLTYLQAIARSPFA